MGSTFLGGQFAGIAVGAAFAYLFLRYLAWSPRGVDPRNSARSHAFWTALIALFASTSANLAGIAAVPAPMDIQYDGDAAVLAGEAAPWAERLATVVAPALWLGLLYVLAQFTWPRPNGRVRTATLAPRTLRNHLPRRLAGVFAGSAVVALAAAAWAWGSPAVAPVPATVREDRTADGALIGSFSVPGSDGYLPGTDVAPLLLLGVALLVAAVWGAAETIVRRSQLGGLSDADNAAVRAVALNRLLRTAVLVVTLFTGAAVFTRCGAEQALWRTADPSQLGSGTTVSGAEMFSAAPWSWLAGMLSIYMLATLVAMAAWSAPRLGAPDPLPGPAAQPGSYTAGRTLLDRAHSMLALLAGLGLLMAGGWAVFANGGTGAQAGWLAVPFVFHLAGLLGCEWLLRRGHCDRRLGRATRHRPPRGPALWAAVGGAAFALSALLSLLAPDGDRALLATLAAWAAAALLLGLALCRFAQARPPLGRGTADEDARLRRLTMHRALRITAGGLLVLAGALPLLGAWGTGAVGASTVPAAAVMATGLLVWVWPVGAAAGESSGAPRPRAPARTRP